MRHVCISLAIRHAWRESGISGLLQQLQTVGTSQPAAAARVGRAGPTVHSPGRAYNAFFLYDESAGLVPAGSMLLGLLRATQIQQQPQGFKTLQLQHP
jgi:hypothetical protein